MTAIMTRCAAGIKGGRKHSVSFWATASQVEIIDKIARELGLSRAQTLRLLVAAGVSGKSFRDMAGADHGDR